MGLTKQTKVTQAHYPRQFEWCTISPDDRLSIVYNVYNHNKNDTKPKTKRPLNLVFVHGTGMCKELWEDMIERFYENYPNQLGMVISLDSVGHNDSAELNADKLGWVQPWTEGGRDIAKLLEDVVAPNTNGPTYLVGHSMGGTQCIFAAYFAPALVDGVITIDPVAFFPSEIRTVDAAAEGLAKLMGAIRKNLRDTFKDQQDYERYMNTRYFSRSFDPKIRQKFIDHAAITNADGTIRFKTHSDQHMIGYYSSLYTALDYHAVKILSMLNCPVLHVAGTIPDFNPSISVEAARESLPRGSEIADIPDGNHLVPFERPKDTFDAILPFVVKTAEHAASRIEQVSQRSSFTPGQRRKLFAEKLDEIHNTYPQNRLYSKL